MTIVSYDLPDDFALCDLDDINMLAQFGIERPSHVITRNRERTQSWARKIYETGRYAGAQWWSYYNPEWRSVAIWDLRDVSIAYYEPLDVKSSLVQNAAAAIIRQIDVR